MQLSGALPHAKLVEGSDGRLYGTTASGGSDDAGTVFRQNKNGSDFQVLRSFTGKLGDGRTPLAGLTEGTDGTLFGRTSGGGTNDMGSIYSLNKDGSGYRVLHNFTAGGGTFVGDGELVQGSDGGLYGTTAGGGTYGYGTVFKLRTDGSDYLTLHSFGSFNDGREPHQLMECSDGKLYGTTAGGSSGLGTVFRLNRDGSDYTLLHRFGPNFSEGASPFGRLLEGSDGTLYGTTRDGGTGGGGTVFKLNKNGTEFEILYNFNAQNGDGTYPVAGLIESGDGAVYGTTTTKGGGVDSGTVYKLNKDGSEFVVLRRFSWPQEPGSEDGSLPKSALVRGSDGMLYGTTPLGGDKDFGVVFRLNVDGSNYTVVHSFGDGPSDANGPGPLIEASDGLLYGTASAAGSNYSGAVFKLNRDGTGYSLLRRFSWDGDGPNQASLIEGIDGALYGTTQLGGSNYAGSIFKMNKDGSGYTITRAFGGRANDGSNPVGGLVRGSDGYIYGTTASGGSNNAGTVFKVNGDGEDYSVLRHFTGTDGDGARPQAALMEGIDGKLYGTTAYGGLNGAGTIFTMNKDGSGYIILRRFIVGEDGGYPSAVLIEASDGALYGENAGGGTNDFGTVFKLGKDGSGYVVLHTFGGGIADGSWPAGGLVEGSDGSLCGTTVGGGLNNGGTVFKLNKDGSAYSVLHHFGGTDGDGSGPNNGLLKGSDGTLYATTYYGGDMGFGTVFKLFSTPPQIIITRVEVSGSGTQLSFSGGAAGQSCRIQAVTHLSPTANWEIVGSCTAAIDGRFKFIDTGASNYPSRVYRSVTP